MVRILLADDHDLVREGIRRILESEHDLAVVQEARDWDELVGLATADDYNILVTDITMPGMGFVHGMRALAEQAPELPILVVTMHAEELWQERAFELGAKGYVHKSNSADRLVEGVRAVVEGRTYPEES